ncbi:MAG TPA: phosphate acyltransferase, partial [Chroococcales cyanobacterium]
MIKPIYKLDQLVELARGGRVQRIALAAAADDDALSALDRAVALGVAQGILVGNPADIKKVAADHGISLDKYAIVPAENDTEAALEAVTLVSSG